MRSSGTGYYEERAEILSALATVPNVVILSGDRHEFAAVEFTESGIHEVIMLFRNYGTTETKARSISPTLSNSSRSVHSRSSIFHMSQS